MTTLQQLAWSVHVHHWRYTHANKPTTSERHVLLALQYAFGEAVGCLIDRGDKLPDSAWKEYQ